MQYAKSVQEFFKQDLPHKKELKQLRKILLSTEMEETLKWGIPVYTVDGKNVVGLSSFKSYYGLWFYQGALLKDKKSVLINAQEGTTKAMRQWRFNPEEKINDKLVLQYLREAIKNQREGKVIPIQRKKKLIIPEVLLNSLIKNKTLLNSFNSLTPFKQREFSDYISDAKRDSTKVTRLEKIIPLIKKGIGLNDKYR